MAAADDTLEDRFLGCLLGLAIGDALGGKFEAQDAEAIRQRFPTGGALMGYPQEEIWYTDDTQMAIGVAETLVAHGQIVEEQLCAAFVANYVPSRGYGRGARAVLEAMEDGRDYLAVAEQYFPGGSYGNGAAMRVAPAVFSLATTARSCGSRPACLRCRRTVMPWALKGRSSWPWPSRTPRAPVSSARTNSSLNSWQPRNRRSIAASSNKLPRCSRLQTWQALGTESRHSIRCPRPSPASP